LRLIHSGRILTDGILLIPWLRSLEERVRRQAMGVGGDVEEVLKEVGLGEDEQPNEQGGGREGKKAAERVWLHCNVGGEIGAKVETDDVEVSSTGLLKPFEGREPVSDASQAPLPSRRRGFDALLDAGLSADEVAQMRRQFYESRGEEVPEGLDGADASECGLLDPHREVVLIIQMTSMLERSRSSGSRVI
jgi:hypothetical protein